MFALKDNDTIMPVAMQLCLIESTDDV